MLKKILISSLVLNFALLLGRLSGFVRELLIARTYGVSQYADVVVLWLALPDLLLNMLAGGAIGAALIPGFIEAKERAKVMWLQSLVAFAIVFYLVAFALQFYSETLIRLLAPGFSNALITDAREGVRIAILLFPLAVLAGINAAFYHFKNQFFIPGIGTLVFNLIIILGLGYVQIAGADSIAVVLIFLGLATICRFMYQFVLIIDLETIRAICVKWFLTKELSFRFVQALLSTGLLFIYPVVGRAYSSYLGEGWVAAFNYTFKLIELPLVLAVTFLSVVFLPSLSKAWVDDKGLFLRLAVGGLEAVLAISVFVMIPVWVFSDSYVNITFGSAINNDVVKVMQEGVRLGSIIIVTQGAIVFFGSVFNAAKKTWVPLLANASALLMYVFLLSNGNDRGMESIIASMVYAQLVGLIIMLVMFFALWRGKLTGLINSRWLLGLVLYSYVFILACDFLDKYGEAAKNLVLLVAYFSGFVVVGYMHPVLKASFSKLVVKIKRDEGCV